MNIFTTKVYLLFTMLVGAFLLAGCNGDGGTNDTGATLTAIAVTPANANVANGLHKQFIAMGTYSDGTSSDISGSVIWVSANLNIATINASGLATGVATGSSLITASVSTPSVTQSATSTLTVTDATLSALTITPANSSIANGLTEQFIATGTYSDGTSPDVTTSVTWSSGNESIATIDESGLVSGIAIGSSLISASLGEQEATTELIITDAILTSITLTPVNPSIALGLNQQFAATGIYSDGTSADITASASWSSADIVFATINDSGLANGVAIGSSLITATFETQSVTSTLTVTDAVLSAIAVTPADPTIAKGLTQQFTATGIYSDSTSVNITDSSVWSSADTLVATVNPGGLASGVAAGQSLITATSGAQSGNSMLTITTATLSSIVVSPINPTIPSGVNKQLAATGTYSDSSVADITGSVTWSSNKPSVATVSNNGLASSLVAGTTSITATLGALSDYTDLEVTAATLDSIAITPINPSIVKDSKQNFVATGNYSDGSSSNITATVTWSSGDVLIATMTPNGQVSSGRASAIKVGSTLIAATIGAISADTTLTVEAALLDNPLAPELGEVERFVILASQAITTTSGSVLVGGDLGILDQARSYYAGFTTGVDAGKFVELTNGLSYAGDDSTPPYVVPAPYASMVAFINQSRTDLGIAYNFLAADPNPNAATQVCPIELGDLTMTRGVYKTASDVTIQTGSLTLDAEGNPDAIFIFTIGGNLTTGAPGGDIVLINGAQAKNVYWRTAGKTVIGTDTTFFGNVFAWSEVNVLTNAIVTGRLFAVTNQVTLDSNNLTAP
ncbi:ice-binding family protein [Psychromonas antarctica]|uniref:ice-binding family protein n=1 Tax=Psychromonas antarctica TaxID=67573 RepID=UPI001EE8A548|nr:ice-binding family protein [Psychromonas antarctica]MCG6202139.1 Ig-like domain-containing protein [Psychromonas antarctica]